ncbi:hypothetical protein F1188_16995 [Roseospira marina]|uniref:Transposase n=1 Tax=Roseospira marina TaxID=140057 RepID=A0A5M6I8Y0_9PROT|nr:hypothetical protein [Roseospira marina]KAA5604265.1 hypothetical protein F1188_16995 [Roseospira marina]MBB4315584.1 hypothetical protein [Roseospira marina]MBB5088580.1 hypothetical protein [Roseospira marina]
MMGQPAFWALQNRFQPISKQGDALEKPARTVQCELLRPTPQRALGRGNPAKSRRRAVDPLLTIRMRVWQAMHGLSLEETEDLVGDLVARLEQAVTETGVLPMSGQIVDATLVAAPRTHNDEEKEARITVGETTAATWPDTPAKARKSTDFADVVQFPAPIKIKERMP